MDNASTDATAEIARRFGARVVREPRKGVARARQTGFEAARGEIIASTDADTRVPPYWLARIVAHFEADPTKMLIVEANHETGRHRSCHRF
ncbi:MAG: glycosyltransferase family A protein [Anaerolineae bacterium]|nr:glycosyltransferase family A protein [Anaerolineae bacterium]